MAKQKTSIPNPFFFKFRVKVPVPGYGSNCHAYRSVACYGINEDDAAKEVVETYPEAIEILPLHWGSHVHKVVPEEVCGRPISPGGQFCTWCGQDPAKHPILSDMPEATEARAWLESIQQESSETVWPRGGEYFE